MFRGILACISALALLLASVHAHAEGSVTFEEADRFLKTAPDLRDHLLATLCISENGMATRLASDYPLGGGHRFHRRTCQKSGSRLAMLLCVLVDRRQQPIGQGDVHAHRFAFQFRKVHVDDGRDPARIFLPPRPIPSLVKLCNARVPSWGPIHWADT